MDSIATGMNSSKRQLIARYVTELKAFLQAEKQPSFKFNVLRSRLNDALKEEIDSTLLLDALAQAKEQNLITLTGDPRQPVIRRLQSS